MPNLTQAKKNDVTYNIKDATARQDISDLKSALKNKLAKGAIIENSYVLSNTGEFAVYNGWNRTDYIPIDRYSVLTIRSSVSSSYNAFYDENKSFIENFGYGITDTTIVLPNNAYYMVLSNSASGLANTYGKFETKNNMAIAELKRTEAETIARLEDSTNEVILNVHMISASKKYMLSDGTYSDGNSHNVVKFSDNSIDRITLPILSTAIPSGLYTVTVKNGDTVVSQLQGSNVEPTSLSLIMDYSDIYINWWGSNTESPWFSTIGLHYKNFEAIEDVAELADTLYTQTNNVLKTVDIALMERYGAGYFEVRGGKINIVSSGSHQCYRIPSDSISYAKVILESKADIMLTFFAVADADGDVLAYKAGQSAGEYSAELPTVENGYLYVNFWNYETYPNPYYSTILIKPYLPITKAYEEDIKKLINSNVSLSHLSRKPFSFAGKAITFVGDSITVGFTSGTTTTHNGYPKLFCDLVGAQANNLAVGGATLSIVEGHDSIQTQLQNADKTKDILFIAGGINDWQLGVSLADFEIAVKTICDYVNANYPNDTPIIWITPINQAGWETTHSLNLVGTVDDYRRIITQTVMKNDTYARFSVLQGKLFNFPTKDADDGFISAMFGDRLHPSELGYKTLYLAGLQTALL